MVHIRSCILIAQASIVGGAALVAVTRHALYLRRHANYSLADALGGGALGGVLGAAVGCALCVLRHATTVARGNLVADWLLRILPFAVAGLLEGALLGLVLGLAIAWFTSRSARRSAGMNR